MWIESEIKMTSTELLQLIQSDYIATELAASGNDEGCAARCRAIAPKQIRETLLTELSIMKIIPDPTQAEAILQQIVSQSVSCPCLFQFFPRAYSVRVVSDCARSDITSRIRL